MCHIIFEQLNVDQICNASGIYSGTNAQSKYKSEQTKWEGNGKVAGHRNILQKNKHLIIKRPHVQGE